MKTCNNLARQLFIKNYCRIVCMRGITLNKIIGHGFLNRKSCYLL